MNRDHFTDYDEASTARCERALVTLLGDVGPWRERIYLIGGLEESNFRWARRVDGVSVVVEFLCETEAVPAGSVFRPKAGSTGSKVGAFNVRGAHLVGRDFVEREIEGERLDGGGRSKVTVRVANVLPYTVLKILAFQDRHENKDAYDLVFCLLHFGDGPDAAGNAAARSVLARDARVTEGLALLGERFRDVEQDGAAAYGKFLAEPDDPEDSARLRREAVATVRAFLDAFHRALA